MKKICKKQIAFLLAILMLVVAVGSYWPYKADAVNAANSADTYPTYMAKLVGTYGGYQYTWVHQEITPTEGMEYKFSCDYYVAEGTYSTATIWSTTVAYDAGEAVKMRPGDIGTMELSYTADAGDNKVYVRFEAQPNTVCYVWNVRLCEKDSDVNLLQNADFSEEGGSWIGWRIKDNTTIKDKATSDSRVATYGQEIIEFDETLLPEGVPTGDPEYMAKIEVPDDSSGWAWVYQGITPEVGKKYRFICNYYVEQGSDGNAVMWTNQNDSVGISSLQYATQGAVELDYEAVSGDNDLMVRFECAPGTICYVWNVCLFEVDGDTNLLTNGSFSKENGWTISKAKMSVMPFDKSLIPAPAYMAKLKGTHIDAEGIMQTYVDVFQSIETTAGITYTFTADYYDSAATGGASILLWSNTSPHGEYRRKTQAATEGTLELSYTATESDTFLSVGMECDPEAECYLWNLSLTAKGSNQNLLDNADFKQGLGSWLGWSIGEHTSITDETTSDAAVAAYGHEIVEFDREFIDSMKAEDALQKTYEDPNAAFQLEDVNQYKNLDLDTPNYMAKLNGTYVNADGVTKKYTWVYQGITPTQGATYHFSCEYYVVDTNQSDSSTVAFMQTKAGDVQKVSLLKGTRGVMKLTYTVGEGENWLNIGFYANPNSTCYIRNIRLHTDDSGENLLKNSNFGQEGGSWIGWMVSENTIIKDKVTSDARTENFGQEILVCDWNLFNEDLANWSVRPQLEETLDFTYQTELTVSQIENSTPEMHFEMYDGDEVIKTEQVQGELGTDGKYRFHLEVLPQQMAHQIIGTLNVQTADGELRQTKQYSVKDYCVSILKDNSCSDELKNLVADLVKYGGATQVKLGFLDTITDEMSSVIKDLGNQGTLADITDAVDTPIQGEQTEAECQWKSASLVLDDKVTIRLKFTTNDVTNLSVHINDTVYTAGGDNKIYLANDNIYYVDLPICASDYSEPINAKFYLDGKAHGAELSYSVHTYLSRMQDSETSKELFQAIYCYGQSASAYNEYLSKQGVESVEQTEIDSYLFSSEGNASSRMNPQTGGADAQAKTMRETIMNADDTVSATSDTVYYISSLHGNDANDGTTPENAWKTIDAYTQHKGSLEAGDTVLFERGGIYRGAISATNKYILSLVSGVTYGAYGTGAKPAIYGSRQNYIGLGSWNKTDTENIWVCNEEMTADVGTIVFNHGQAVGVKRLGVSDDLTTNLTELKDNFEFYHDLENGKLYLYMDSNPALTFYDIEICENSYMLFAAADSQNITLDNLSLKYSGGHAIRFDPRATNIKITNCEIGFIGGSLQTEGQDTRYGNGIEFWNACSNITVQNNWIYQIYDAGFTHQGGTVSGGYEQKDITFNNNLVEYCSFGIEFWAGNPEQDVMSNISYKDNMIRLSGYGWGVVRPNAFGVSAINTWGYETTFTANNFKIENNVFDLSTRALMLSYNKTNPAVTYTGNSYYLKEGYVALWQGQKFLAADDQSTMETSVGTVDTSPSVVQFITE